MSCMESSPIDFLVPLSMASGLDEYRSTALTVLRDVQGRASLSAEIEFHGMSAAYGWLIATDDSREGTQFDAHVEAWRANRVKTEAFVLEARRVTSELEREGIDVVVTKGVVSQSRLYNCLGKRVFSDIDLMIRPADVEKVRRILSAIGFREGFRYDATEGRLVPLERAVVLKYRMYPDHLVPHVRLGGSTISHYEIDTAYSLTWHQSPWQIPNELHIDRRVSHDIALSDGQIVTLPAMSPEYDLAFTLLHLFREGWQLTTDSVSGLRLNQFADAALAWAALDQSEKVKFANLLKDHSLVYPICWIASKVDCLTGSDMIATMQLEPFCDEEWLGSFRGKGDSFFSTPCNVRDLFEMHGRVKLVSVSKPAVIS